MREASPRPASGFLPNVRPAAVPAREGAMVLFIFAMVVLFVILAILVGFFFSRSPAPPPEGSLDEAGSRRVSP